MGLRAWVRRVWLKLTLKLVLKELEEMAFLKALLTSKKAAAVFAGILTVLLKELLGLDPETVDQLVKLIIGYLFAQGGVDAVLAFRNRKTE